MLFCNKWHAKPSRAIKGNWPMTNLDKERAALGAVRPLSLCEFLSERGGIKIMTGQRKNMGAAELLSMNAERWHKAKPFRKKLLRDDEGMNPDFACMCAWEAGYFHGRQDRPEINELLDLIATDLASGSVYSEFDHDEIMRIALSDDELPDDPMVTHEAPKDFRIPIRLRTIAPPHKAIPPAAKRLEGFDGLEVWLYRTEQYRRHGRSVTPYLAKVLGGAEHVVKFWAKAFPSDGTLPAWHKAFDSEVERAWVCDDYLHPCPF
jgi:hypothetical protein